MSKTPRSQDKKFKPYLQLLVCVFLVFLSITAIAHNLSIAEKVDKAKAQDDPQSEKKNNEDKNEAPSEVDDPLGRSTPHGTVVGFLQATQNGKNEKAAQYLQLSKNERATRGEQIARQLHELMDNAFLGRVGTISGHREGSVQEGVPQDHERIGQFRLHGNETNVDLVRVYDPQAGEIWLFSSRIVADVPELFSQLESSEVESRLPRFLATRWLFSTPLWRIIVFVLLIPVSFGLAWGIVKLSRMAQSLWLRWKHPLLQDVHNSFAGPTTVILTVAFHQIGVYFLGVSLLIRAYYQQLTAIILIVGVAWLVLRLINRWGERARLKALTSSGYRSGSMVLLGQRFIKGLVVVVAVLIMLSVLGFDMATAVAGLGIGSIAVAFAAQKTLENLLGGISIIGDQVIRVGELCRIDDKVGTVEDISLRSTRIRTLDRTELSVPNGQLANMTVENLSRSNKSAFRAKIGLRHETSPEQLRLLLKEIPVLLRRHPKVDPDVVRARFVGFGESSLDVEIQCHILTGDFNEFLAIREDLLLQIMDLVIGAGTGFAVPARSLFVVPEQDQEHERTATTKRNVSGLRDAS
jgi:MscS family membrane protein